MMTLQGQDAVGCARTYTTDSPRDADKKLEAEGLTPKQLTFQTAFSVSFPLLWNLEGFGVPVYTGKHVIIIHREKPSATEAPP